MSKYKIYHDGTWYDPCDNNIRIYHDGEWRLIGNGAKYYLNGEWVEIVCAIPESDYVVDESTFICQQVEPDPLPDPVKDFVLEESSAMCEKEIIVYSPTKTFEVEESTFQCIQDNE